MTSKAVNFALWDSSRKYLKLKIWGKSQREFVRRRKSIVAGKFKGGGRNFPPCKVMWPELK